MQHFNYIFTGSGLSALMTVYKMIMSKKFQDKSILLLDSDIKKNNDRTWCFWEKANHNWENIVSKKWDIALFANQKYFRNLDINPYQYNMIRGLDFYNLVFDLISKQPNISFLNQKVVSVQDDKNKVLVNTENNFFSCDKLFNSIYNNKVVSSQSKYPLLKQHFIGWFIKSEQPVFDPKCATFMDFSLNQDGNTKFMYVLPTSETEALIEPTLFSHNHLKQEAYEAEIIAYIKRLGIKNYTVSEVEQGSIPMTVYPFWKSNTNNIINIGSAGGWTKASTGFTFRHSDKKSSKLIAFILSNDNFIKFYKKTKFWYYDAIFLEVLDKHNELGSKVFSALFKSGDPSLVFKFLDEETSFWQDLQVIWKCPKTPFIKAMFRVIFKL